MTIAVVSSVSASPGSGGGATGSIDTTGADLIVLSASWYNAASVTPTDSKSNAWTALTESAQGTTKTQLWYAVNPTVGTGHTFTWSQSSSYPAICVVAFSGVDTTSPFDQQNTANGANLTSLQAGSVTPTEDDEMLASSICLNGTYTGLSIDSSFTIQEEETYGFGLNMGGAMSYKVQTTAGAENPDWSWSTYLRDAAAAIATFKATAGGGGAAVPRVVGAGFGGTGMIIG